MGGGGDENAPEWESRATEKEEKKRRNGDLVEKGKKRKVEQEKKETKIRRKINPFRNKYKNYEAYPVA